MKQFNNTEFTTLAEAQAYEEKGMADVDDVIEFFTRPDVDLMGKLEDIAAGTFGDPYLPLRSAAISCLTTLRYKKHLKVHSTAIQDMMDAFVNAVFDKHFNATRKRYSRAAISGLFEWPCETDTGSHVAYAGLDEGHV